MVSQYQDVQRYGVGSFDSGTSSALPLATASGSTNTKGSWVEIDASVDFDAAGFYLVIEHGSNAAADKLLDIGEGAAASEVAIVSNLLLGQPVSFLAHAWQVHVPIPVKAGTRLSARLQCTDASQALRIQVTYYAGVAPESLALATTYGANTSDSGGVSIDPGGAANTKGAYSEISASISGTRHLLIGVGGQNNGARSDAFWRCDIAIGAGGSELVVIPDIPLFVDGIHHLIAGAPIDRILALPNGIRMAGRAQCSITDATDRLFDLSVIGVR